MTAESSRSSRLLDNLVLFGRVLRGAGIDVSSTQVMTLAEGLDHIDIGRRDDFKSAARAVLVGRRSHLELFDRLFDLFWRSGGTARPPAEIGRLLRRSEDEPRSVVALAAPGRDDRVLEREVEPSLAAYSREELLRRKDFADLDPEELATVRRLLDTLDLELASRRTRRRERWRKGRHLDLRQTLRLSLRHGGEPLELARRRRKLKRRPLVMLCDVSASMEIYSRILLQFLYAVGRSSDAFEAFLFGTRLTRVTRHLRGRNVSEALAASAAAARDWGGGTRIGETLKRFNFEWGRRVLGQGAVAVLISDGWDCGDVELLAREMARLRRNCDRLIWLNPLLGSPGYEPLTRGMRAALPHVDDFLPVHNLASLEQLADALARLR